MAETGVVKVYIDVVMLVNFIMDYFLLWATGKTANLQARPLRLFFGAGLGALYSLMVLFPRWPTVTSFLAKIICSLFMVWITFKPDTLAKICRSLLFMYIISFAMGGAVIASLYLTDSSPGYMQVLNGMGILWNINFMWLFTGIVTAFLISYSGIAYLRKNWLHQQLINELTINIGNTTLTVPAFLDTGNQLTDPITKTPVIVIETEALRQIIPEHILKKINEDDAQINELIASLDNENKDKGNKDKENGHKGNEDKGNEDKESEDKESKVKENGYKVNEGKENDEDTENDDLLLKDKDILNRIRLIPFNSVGRTHGLLVGLKPDNVVIKNRHKTFTTNNVVLGLVNRSLSKEGQYRALLHPLVFQDNM